MLRSFLKQRHQTNGDSDRATSNGHQEHLDLQLDAVVIGAGFAGVYLLHRLRQEGYRVKLVEAGSGLGGIWYWNNYPGARVDSQYPVYALDIPEVYSTWDWSEQYPGSAELQRYFRHIDDVLDISKDTLYETRVNAARWDDTEHMWHLECDNGTRITTRFLNCCLGFAAKRHFPDWPGLDSFAGYMCHSSFWPVEGIDVHDKTVAVIGNGATGIQIAQTMARDAAELKVFIRTPNTCLPMNQQRIAPETVHRDRAKLHQLLHTDRYVNAGGFLYPEGKNMLDDSPEERDRALGAAFDRGGFEPLFLYNDILVNDEANRYLHDFWARRTRARISDPVKRDILAPLEPLHPFLGKRPSLEQDYYEQMDSPHVKLVNLRELEVSHVVPEGIVTSDGETHEVDVIAIATGFDSLTGSFTQIDMRGMENESLSEKWNTDQGALSYLGMAVHNFPNMFYTYGPHSPTAYGNGPSIVQPQGDWIVDAMNHMRDHGETKINANADSEAAWKKRTNELHAMTLRDKVDSWYTGTNIPGKPRQALNYAGGLPLYLEEIRQCAARGYEGFTLS